MINLQTKITKAKKKNICSKSDDLSVSKFWKQIGINEIELSSLGFINGVGNPGATPERLHFQGLMFILGCLYLPEMKALHY